MIEKEFDRQRKLAEKRRSRVLEDAFAFARHDSAATTLEWVLNLLKEE